MHSAKASTSACFTGTARARNSFGTPIRAAVLELSAAIKGDARVFVFVARADDEGSVAELGLPELARATHLYRGGRFLLVEPATKVVAGDEAVVISDARNLKALHKRWGLPGDRRAANEHERNHQRV